MTATLHLQGVYSVAYAPLGVPEGRIEGVAPSLKEKPILEVAEATGRSPAQVCGSLRAAVAVMTHQEIKAVLTSLHLVSCIQPSRACSFSFMTAVFSYHPLLHDWGSHPLSKWSFHGQVQTNDDTT